MGRRGTQWDLARTSWDAYVLILSFVRLVLVNRKIVDPCKFMESRIDAGRRGGIIYSPYNTPKQCFDIIHRCVVGHPLVC